MPSRFFTIFILLFWAVSTGWFVYSEFWPRFRGGDPPLFTIDLADEARRNSPPINWDIIRRGKTIGRASTSIHYRDEDDSFDLIGTVHDLDLGKASPVQVSHMANTYRVTRDGQLLAVSTEATVRLGPAEINVFLEGKLVGNSFLTTLRFDTPVLGKKEIAFAPVAMTARGSALNPLHPVDRINGLSLGKSWSMALVDPVRDALTSQIPGAQTGVAYLRAAVLPELQRLEWGGREQLCYVIEYSGKSVQARTWVLARDGTVLRQEARLDDEELILERVSY